MICFTLQTLPGSIHRADIELRTLLACLLWLLLELREFSRGTREGQTSGFGQRVVGISGMTRENQGFQAEADITVFL